MAQRTGRMEIEIRKHFDEILAATRSVLGDLNIEEDISKRRALLKVKGSFGVFDVRITEIIDQEKRKYAYYLIHNGKVEYGCDNAPDIKALKLKYRDAYCRHLNEPVPHAHGKGKKSLELTDEMSVEDFFKRIKERDSTQKCKNRRKGLS